MRFKLSGRLRFRFQAVRILIGSGLYVTLRRILRGPLLPSWSLLFEASSHFQKAIYKAVYRFPDVKDGRELVDALVVQVPSLEKVSIEPTSSPTRGAWFRPETFKTERVILYCHGAYAFYARAEQGFIADVAVITGLRFCSPFSGGYNASAPPVAQKHWLPATQRPDPYRDRTAFGDRLADDSFQDTPTSG